MTEWDAAVQSALDQREQQGLPRQVSDPEALRTVAEVLRPMVEADQRAGVRRRREVA